MSSLYVRVAGGAFFLLGALWIILGFYVDEAVVWLFGGLAAAAGMGLMGLASRFPDRDA